MDKPDNFAMLKTIILSNIFLTYNLISSQYSTNSNKNETNQQKEFLISRSIIEDDESNDFLTKMEYRSPINNYDVMRSNDSDVFFLSTLKNHSFSKEEKFVEIFSSNVTPTSTLNFTASKITPSNTTNTIPNITTVILNITITPIYSSNPPTPTTLTHNNVGDTLNTSIDKLNFEIITPVPTIKDRYEQLGHIVQSDNLIFFGHHSDKSHHLKTQVDKSNATIVSKNLTTVEASNETKIFYIGFLFSTLPRSLKNVFYPWAFKYAIERSNSELLSSIGHRLEPMIKNFTVNKTLKTQTEFYINGTSAFIGPEDNCAIEARLASAWNIPMIAFKCSDSSVSNHKIYPTFARTSPSTYKVSKSVISLMKYFGWTHYQAVVGNRDTWKEATKSLAKLAIENGITMNTDEYITEPFFQVSQEIITKTNKNTRIYIYFGDPEGLIDFVRAMMESYLDNGEYLVIAVREETFDPKKNRKYLMKYYEKLEKPMIDAFATTLMLFPRTPQETQEYKEFKDKMREYSQQKVYGTYRSPDNASLTVQVSVYAAHLYDAVYVYAKALLACILDQKDPNDGSDVLSKIKNSTHESIQGHNIYIDEDGDAEANYTVVALIEDDEDDDDEDDSLASYLNTPSKQISNISKRSLGKSKPGTYRRSNYNRMDGLKFFKSGLASRHDKWHWKNSRRNMATKNKRSKKSTTDEQHPKTVSYKSLKRVGHFASNGKDIPDFIYEREINWINGKAPVSEPECGFDDSKCQIQSAFPTGWPIALICIVFGSMMATGVIFMARHYIYEQKVASLLWKIEYKDLLMADPEHEHPLSEKMRGRFGRLSYLSIEESRDDSIKRAKHTFTRIASFKGSLVAVKLVKKKHLELTREMKKELHLMREMAHDNVNRFIGACIDLPHVCIVTQYCSRGSLKDIIENEDLHLDDVFIASLVFDLIKGMIFLHDSEIISHGNLNTSNCLVDSRWVLQISDYGLHSLRNNIYGPSSRKEEAILWEKLQWKAPELLRDRNSPPRGSQKGDVYSFGLILIDIHGRSGPWGPMGMTAKEIVEKVTDPNDGWLLRPDLSQLKCQDFVVRCIQECSAEEPELRPDFKYIRMRLKPMQEGLSSNIFDNMLAIMEKYANTLETLVDERTFQLAQEKKTTETLLLRMLPKSVAEQLIHGEQVRPEQYECVTIYFSDIVDFTSLSAESTPLEIVDMLNDLYTSFDSIIEAYDVYKVETIGDAYMVVSGLPIRNGDNHAGEIASMSLHLLRAIKDFKIRHRPQETLMLRIGIHSGPVVAGVVGLKMPRYCLFGDTVNTASRMESTGESLKIHCSHQSMLLLKKLGGYTLVERGPISVKGKGQVVTYFLIGEDISQRRRRMSAEKPELFSNDKTSNLFPILDEEGTNEQSSNETNKAEISHRERSNSSIERSRKCHAQSDVTKFKAIKEKDCSAETSLDDNKLPIVIITSDESDNMPEI